MALHYHTPKERAKIASKKKMSPWAKRTKRQGSVEDVKVPTTEKSRTERLTRKAAIEARMTPAERRRAERRRVDDFMQKRNEQLKPHPATPAAKSPPRRGVLGKRRDLLEALGQKKGKK